MPGTAEDVEETEEQDETDEVPTDTSAPRDALGEGDGSDEYEIDRYSCHCMSSFGTTVLFEAPYRTFFRSVKK